MTVNKETLLNTRQKQILKYIKETLRTKGYPPSVREIGEAVGLSSSSTVHSYLSKLEALGFIRRDPTKPRAIDVLDEAPWRQKNITPVPLVGRVTAGTPILAVENIEETYPLPTELVGNDDVFMLTVQGDSMIEAGILDGDYILIRSQNTARNGDIIVALIDEEEATVKRFFKEKDCIRLQPENPAMEPIYSRQVTILGKVIGVFRRLQ
ncbi:transcriptional repressor LexA [Sporomusa sphaeroides]|uniref:LexA repressor n=2 Tax=Sporomusa TaxID=2375 RepID=A0ABM9W6R9_9FIRM|nr:transcriptional repressor LexA [Sporomusa sphaeroides]OLS58530.1 LexA repressor [Sporomusa sphaeroides DSM 2875]CVK19670.1 LexA repressor [Sporomusa sphaeroides DSM 2875]SCM80106.1 LexA repressor [uncultured Sporomusa sp.]